jgi:hypothetical protein
MWELHFQINKFLLKIKNNKKIAPEGLKKIKNIQNELTDYIKDKRM